jgi:hypothetical protein
MGLIALSSRIQVPNPPARMIAFMNGKYLIVPASGYYAMA